MFGKHYALIITDLQMPQIDGYEASSQIRDFCEANNVPQARIIACTGHTEQKYIDRAWKYQIDEVISKPLNINVVEEILTEFFSKES